MSWWDGLAYDSSIAMRKQAEERERAAVARRAVIGAAVQEVEDSGSLAAMRRLVELLAEHHRIRITWREPGNGAYGYASGKSHVAIPPIRSEQDFAVCLHEIGHCLSERCAGGDHRGQSDGRWWKCIRCEVLAWDRAITLVPLPFRGVSPLEQSFSARRATF